MFGNCVLQKKKKDFCLQGKGNKIMFCLSVLKEGGENENIQLVFDSFNWQGASGKRKGNYFRS